MHDSLLVFATASLCQCQRLEVELVEAFGHARPNGFTQVVDRERDGTRTHGGSEQHDVERLHGP